MSCLPMPLDKRYPTYHFKPSSVAFASYVDKNYLPGFRTMLKSLILTNPWFNFPYIVFTDELSPQEKKSIKTLYTSIAFRDVDKSIYENIKKTDSPKPHNKYLIEKAYYFFEAFRIADFEKVVFLDDDLLFLKDISAVLEAPGHIAAVETKSKTADKKELNSGFVVMNGAKWRAEAFDAILKIGSAGNYNLDFHDQGLLNAFLDGDFTRLSWKFNAVKRLFADATSIPGDLRVIHYVGKTKPWTGKEKGYGFIDSFWHDANTKSGDFFAKAAKKCADFHNFRLALFYAKAGIKARRMNWKTTRPIIGKLIKSNRLEAAEQLIDELKMMSSVFSLYERGRIAYVKGKYSDAEKLLLKTVEMDIRKADALTLLAELTITTRRYGQAELYLREAALVSPLTSGVQARARLSFYEALDARRKPVDEIIAKGNVFAHVAGFVPNNTNAGDEVVPLAVQKSFEHVRPGQEWTSFHCQQRFADAEVQSLNAHRAIVIGGGGLFLNDTAANRTSGWQWDISSGDLERITSPVIVFGAGYNRFKNQEDFIPLFSKSLGALMGKAVFFGLRNRGSCEAVKRYLPAEYQDKVVFQPCPTTTLRHIYPGFFRDRPARKNIVVNIALDRAPLRFGSEYEEFVHEFAKSIRRLMERENLVYAAHTVSDSRFILDIARQEDVHLPMARFYDERFSATDIIKFYRDAKLAIGMRGHSILIPLGCGTPVIGVSAHPKISYTMLDMNLGEWLLPIDDFSSASLDAMTEGILSGYARAEEMAIAAEEEMHTITADNVRRIYDSVETFWRRDRIS